VIPQRAAQTVAGFDPGEQRDAGRCGKQAADEDVGGGDAVGEERSEHRSGNEAAVAGSSQAAAVSGALPLIS